jgi:hypothetical protein
MLLSLLLLSGCGIVKLSGFSLDEEMIRSFKESKQDITTIMNECKSRKDTQLLERKDLTKESFDNCKIDPVTLKKINIKEVYRGYAKSMNTSYFFHGSPILFKIDEVESIGINVFVEEKGYIFSETPIKDNLLERGSLDRLFGTELFKKRGIEEEWRFKQIEPNWYLYYRQYYAGFMS